jgi:hypothetical protein
MLISIKKTIRGLDSRKKRKIERILGVKGY